MEWFFDQDPLTGAVETFDYDEMTETAVIHRRSVDLTPLLDANKEMANHGTRSRAAPGEMDVRLEARLTPEIQLLWLQKHGVRAWDKNHAEGVKRLLNSNEYRYLRTSNVIL
jgi:hypothetical protein